MIIHRLVCRLGTMLALVAMNTAAQTDLRNWSTVEALTTGIEVRITAGSRTVRGKIDRITDDALTMTSGKSQGTFDRQQISVVSVKKPGHRKRNALIGLGAGTGAGLGIGIAARSKPGQLQLVPNGAVVAVFTVAGALVGTVVGVVIPTGGWREIYQK